MKVENRKGILTKIGLGIFLIGAITVIPSVANAATMEELFQVLGQHWINLNEEPFYETHGHEQTRKLYAEITNLSCGQHRSATFISTLMRTYLAQRADFSRHFRWAGSAFTAQAKNSPANKLLDSIDAWRRRCEREPERRKVDPSTTESLIGRMREEAKTQQLADEDHTDHFDHHHVLHNNDDSVDPLHQQQPYRLGTNPFDQIDPHTAGSAHAFSHSGAGAELRYQDALRTAAYQRELERLHHELARSREDTHRLREQLEEQERQHLATRQTAHHNEQGFAGLEALYRSQIEEAYRLRQAALGRAEELQARMTELEAQMEAADRSHQEGAAHSAAHTQQQHSELDRLQQERQQLLAELNQVRDQLAQQGRRHEADRLQLMGASDEAHTAQQQMARRLQKREQEVARHRDDAQRARDEARRAATTAQQHESQNAELRARLQALQQHHEQNQQALDEAQHQEAAQRNARHHEANHQRARDENAQILAHADALQHRIAALAQREQELQDLNERLHARARAHQDDRTAVAQRIRELEQEIARQHEAAHNEREDFQRQIAAIRAHDQRDARIAALEERHQRYEEALQARGTLIEALRDENQRLQNQHDRLYDLYELTRAEQANRNSGNQSVTSYSHQPAHFGHPQPGVCPPAGHLPQQPVAMLPAVNQVFGQFPALEKAKKDDPKRKNRDKDDDSDDDDDRRGRRRRLGAFGGGFAGGMMGFGNPWVMQQAQMAMIMQTQMAMNMQFRIAAAQQNQMAQMTMMMPTMGMPYMSPYTGFVPMGGMIAPNPWMMGAGFGSIAF